MNWFEIVKIVLMLVPAIIDIIKKMEEIIPDSGMGQTKLEMVKNIVVSLHENAATLWPMIEKVVGIIVATFNAIGLFKKEA